LFEIEVFFENRNQYVVTGSYKAPEKKHGNEGGECSVVFHQSQYPLKMQKEIIVGWKFIQRPNQNLLKTKKPANCRPL
jgi:hypothetical protein